MRKLAIPAVLVILAFARTAGASNCSWTAAPTNINFGNYSVFSPGALLANSTFTINCTPNTTGRITLNRGTNSASYTPRTLKLTAGSVYLNYNLYVDPAATTQIWGDGTGGTTYYEQYNSTPQNKSFTDQIFGQLPAVSDIGVGVYNDTLIATLTWGGGSSITQQFTVQTTVIAECVVNTFGINFGAYDPLGANASSPRTASAVLNVYCTKGAVGTVSLDTGTNFSGSLRRMKNASGAFMNYNIYKDGAYATVWDTTNVNSATSTSRYTPLAGGFTAYGSIPANQDVAIGNYSDTVQATVNY
jgi:spore coat protein U-like protein